jgi:hypothetical protein
LGCGPLASAADPRPQATDKHQAHAQRHDGDTQAPATFNVIFKYPGSNRNATAEEAQSHNKGDNPFWLDWEFYTAVGTILLAVGTIVLGLYTRIAAIAARDAASGLPVLERAYVYPEIVEPGAFERLLAEARVYYLDGLDSYDKRMPEVGKAKIKFTNFGKTPAVLKAAFASVGIAPFGGLLGLSLPDGVLGSSGSTQPIPCLMDVGFTRNQAEKVGAYLAHVCIDGQVIFEDIWGVTHQTDFYFIWDLEIKAFVLKETRSKILKDH